jgi:hypothetical protein
MIAETEIRPTLFDLTPVITPAYPRRATIQERFELWITVNPHFWRAFVGLCLQMKRRGMARWSTKAAVEVLRYQAYLQTLGDAYKIPNDITSRLARKAMQECPELDGFFETRELRSE